MNTTVDLRRINTLKVLDIIARRQPVRKNELREKTGLTIITINNIVNDLIKRGVLEEKGLAESSWGRKASLFSFHENYNYILAININIDHIDVALFNIGIQMFKKISIPHVSGGYHSNWPLIADAAAGVAESAGINLKQVLGAGITVPGLVDNAGKAVFLPNMDGWNGADIGRTADEELGVRRVFVEKDVYAAILTHKLDADIEKRNVVSVNISGGIGCGILIGGRILRGENGVAGEIGHLSMDLNGPLCKCGNNGCLEMYASDYAILSKAREHLRENGEPLTIDKMISAARDGDALCRRLFAEASVYIGLAIKNIIKCYDPSLVVIESQWVRELPFAFETILGELGRSDHMLHHFIQNAKIVVNTEPDYYLKGAAMLVYDHFMSSINDNVFLDGNTALPLSPCIQSSP